MEPKFGFYLVVTRGTSYFCREIDVGVGGVDMKGPRIITMSVVEDTQSKRMVPKINTDKVVRRFIPMSHIVQIDEMSPAEMDKQTKAIYTELGGIDLV